MNDQCLTSCGSANVAYGSRLCENSGAGTIRAIIESGTELGRIIIAAKTTFLNQYFVSVARKPFSHSLGQKQTLGSGRRMSALPLKADVEGVSSDVRCWVQSAH